MTNVEKHEKIKEERSYRVHSSAAPTVRRYVSNHRNGGSAATGEPTAAHLG